MGEREKSEARGSSLSARGIQEGEAPEREAPEREVPEREAPEREVLERELTEGEAGISSSVEPPRAPRPSPLTGRLDKALREAFALSHRRARRWIQDGKVFIEGIRCLEEATEVREGELLELKMSAPRLSRLRSLGAELIYADDALCVLNKPAGLLSAPLRGSDAPHALKAAGRLCRGARRPRVVHRLDQDTSGLLIFARTIPATRRLQEMIEGRAVERRYRCLVRGQIRLQHAFLSSELLRDRGDGRRGSAPGSFQVSERLPQSEAGAWRDQLQRGAQERGAHASGERDARRQRGQRDRRDQRDRHDRHDRNDRREQRGQRARSEQREPVLSSGQPALSELWLVRSGAAQSALELKLHSGRTHQLRIHLAELGHPLLGERVYGQERGSAPRQALHAALLRFPHPFSGEQLSFESPWPDDLARLPGLPNSWRSEVRRSARGAGARKK